MSCSQPSKCDVDKLRSARIHMIDGEPDGVRVAELGISSIKAVAFRRGRLPFVRELARNCKEFPEIERPGVYLLIGAYDEEGGGRLPAYIGQADSVGDRLKGYASGKSDEKDDKSYWTDTIALFAKKSMMTTSHARYAERLLIRSVDKDDPRWELKNRNKGNKANLGAEDKGPMRQFVNETKLLVNALGCDLFIKRTQKSSEKEIASEERPVFFAETDDYQARMTVDDEGKEFVVLKGSKAWKCDPSDTMSPGYVSMRNILLEKKILRDEDGYYVFSKDCIFKSPSAAGAMVRGSNVNGFDFWKLPGPKNQKSQTYGDLERKKAESS